jgi:hypothetical protein
MRSAIHSAILAFALSVSAAPVGKNSSANKGAHSSTHSLTPRGGPSGDHWYDEASGPPVFFGDQPSTYKGPSHNDDVDPKDLSPSPYQDQVGTPAGKESSVTTSAALPFFGSIKPSTTSTKVSSTQSFSTYTSSSKPTSTEHTKTRASSAHKSSNTHIKAPFHKSSTYKPNTRKSSANKSNTHKPNTHKSTTTSDQSLAPARLVTPNFKSYIAKAGTLMFGMQNPICSAVTLIFARGTTEVGNMGTCVGPDLAR